MSPPSAQYLAATGCPLPPHPRLPALLWLLSQAVALEYRDAGAWLPDEAIFALRQLRRLLLFLPRRVCLTHTPPGV